MSADENGMISADKLSEMRLHEATTGRLAVGDRGIAHSQEAFS
jgi:hypothetical protein